MKQEQVWIICITVLSVVMLSTFVVMAVIENIKDKKRCG